MKISITLVALTALFATALFGTACSKKDSQDSKSKPVVQKKEDTGPKVNFYKITIGEDCRTFSLEKEITETEATEKGLQSAMALCEERLKPEANSKSEDTKVARYECLRGSEAKIIIDDYNACSE